MKLNELMDMDWETVRVSVPGGGEGSVVAVDATPPGLGALLSFGAPPKRKAPRADVRLDNGRTVSVLISKLGRVSA